MALGRSPLELIIILAYCQFRFVTSLTKIIIKAKNGVKLTFITVRFERTKGHICFNGCDDFLSAIEHYIS